MFEATPWSLAAATRQVTLLEVTVRCKQSRDFDIYDVAGVVADLLERDGLDPAAIILNYIAMRDVLNAVLDENDRAAASDAVSNIAYADAARSAAHLNHRNTSTQNLDCLSCFLNRHADA